MEPRAPDARRATFTVASVPENYGRHLAPVVFVPWAEVLIERTGVRPGDRVLDVASGTGVVARMAADRAGPSGHVVASDVSPAMLARAAGRAPSPDAAPIEFVHAPAAQLPFPDAGFDVVLCQQGLQFFEDRLAALRELARATRPGGALGLAVWAIGHRLEPFDDYAEALAAVGVEPPFPGAFDPATFSMSRAEVRALLEKAGWTDTDVEVVELAVTWPDAQAATAGILGTPFGPSAADLAPALREMLEADLRRRFVPERAGEPVTRTAAAVLARAVAA